MSKKIAKILGGLAAVGAAAAGVFYWYKKKNSEADFEDEFNEDFEAEEFVIEDDLKDVSDRGYTTLTPSAESETVEETTTEEAVVEECCCQEEDNAEECTCSEGCCCQEEEKTE